MLKLAVSLLLLPCMLMAAPSFDAEVQPILKEHCTGCHNPDKLKADLDLTTWTATMKGGSSGVSVKPGSADMSLLYRVTAHEEEPEMPPKKPKIPDAQVAVLREWINAGATETAGGTQGKSRDAALTAALPVAQADGPPPMPEKDPAHKLPAAKRPAPVQAMAVSPRAPLLAVAVPGGVRLFDTATQQSRGALPFPDGTPAVVRFSASGGVLLAAGGRAAHSGSIVAWDVRTSAPVATAGAEFTDSVTAADISPDHKMIAAGGTDKLVRIYSGGKLARTIKKHTDWVTALAFSPDGTKLATADRNGGLHLWDPATGTILYTLAEHQARVSSLAWRADSLILASAGEDGKLILWDTAEGWAAKSSAPHDAVKKDPPGRKTMLLKVPGVLSAHFAPDGRLVTAGRDNTVRIYRTNGAVQHVLKDFRDVPLNAAFVNGGGSVVTGDFSGQIRVWELKEKEAVPAGELQ